MSGSILLPPVLYWSESLAVAANREEPDPRHGLIDATDANMLATTWCAGWTFIAEMPADAVQLVEYVPVADIAVEHGVRWPETALLNIVEEHPTRAAAEKVARQESGEVVQRVVRRGMWKPVTS